MFRNKAGDRELTIYLRGYREKEIIFYLGIKEAIPFSQRVEKFFCMVWQKMEEKRKWWMLTIGYMKIIDGRRNRCNRSH